MKRCVWRDVTNITSIPPSAPWRKGMAATWRIVLPFLAYSTASFFGNGFATDGLAAVGAVFFLGVFSRPLFFLVAAMALPIKPTWRFRQTSN